MAFPLEVGKDEAVLLTTKANPGGLCATQTLFLPNLLQMSCTSASGTCGSRLPIQMRLIWVGGWGRGHLSLRGAPARDLESRGALAPPCAASGGGGGTSLRGSAVGGDSRGG